MRTTNIQSFGNPGSSRPPKARRTLRPAVQAAVAVAAAVVIESLQAESTHDSQGDERTVEVVDGHFQITCMKVYWLSLDEDVACLVHDSCKLSGAREICVAKPASFKEQQRRGMPEANLNDAARMPSL